MRRSIAFIMVLTFSIGISKLFVPMEAGNNLPFLFEEKPYRAELLTS